MLRKLQLRYEMSDKGWTMTQLQTKLTPAHALFLSTLARLGETLALAETKSDDQGPWLTLTSHAPFHQGTCGHARLFTAVGLFKIVTCSITASAIGLDSHMLFALTPSDSCVPHFTVDSVQSGDQMAFHLDLIPRVDLGTNLAYMDWAFAGLNAAFEGTAQIEGLAPALISPRQRATMSPWMVVHRATAQAFDQVEPLVHSYADHWLGLLARGPPPHVLAGLSAADLIGRDRANKAIIFDPDVDKVWNQIRGLIGDESVEAIRVQLLQTSDTSCVTSQ
jgi:hypothetical protein